MTADSLFFILAGYLSGSILYAPIFRKLLKGKDIVEESRDHNPGTASAFLYGGFLCGLLTLCADMAKGFIPVFLYLRRVTEPDAVSLALVLAAPVIGFGLIVLSVMIRMVTSREEKGVFEVKLLWRR